MTKMPINNISSPTFQPQLAITKQGKVVTRSANSIIRRITEFFTGRQALNAQTLNKLSQSQFENLRTNLLTNHDPQKFEMFLQHVSREAPHLTQTTLKPLENLFQKIKSPTTTQITDPHLQNRINEVHNQINTLHAKNLLGMQGNCMKI